MVLQNLMQGKKEKKKKKKKKENSNMSYNDQQRTNSIKN